MKNNSVTELFGISCSQDNKDIMMKALADATCPYTNTTCFKSRKSTPGVKIGTCTVSYKNGNIIICPRRLLDKKQIFFDCLHLLERHEPGNQLYTIPEIKIPGGMVDFFLVSAKQQKVQDFVGIELQTLDTSGTVWPARLAFLKQMGIEEYSAEEDEKKSFGMNWKMTAKTILMQMHHKAETFESLNKHLVLVVQKPLLQYMAKEFDFAHINGPLLGNCVHIHSYEFDSSRFALSLEERLSTDANGIAKCLGKKQECDFNLDEIIKTIESKLSDDFRLTF